MASIRYQKDIVLSPAPSAITETLVQGGRTVHSDLKFQLNIQIIEILTCNISEASKL